MTGYGRAFRTMVVLAALAVAGIPAPAGAAGAGHGDMHGGAAGGHGAAAGHDMMMGDKVFAGPVGPWKGEARIMDMKAGMAASGMKMAGPMPNSHHVSLTLVDPNSKGPVTQGKGTVTVTGPDKKAVKTELMAMQGHFGADVNLPMPGKYTIRAEVTSGGKSGSAVFTYDAK